MSNKLKYAPSPPPEPVVVESLEPEKKKRGEENQIKRNNISHQIQTQL